MNDRFKNILTIEKETQGQMTGWHRVKDALGSTVAYTPDCVTAQEIADALNDCPTCGIKHPNRCANA